MHYEEDWLMRQINVMTNLIFQALLKKEVKTEEIFETDLTKISRHIHKLLDLGEINESENYLFDNMEMNNLEYLKLGVKFYERLNEMTDEELKDKNFSRKEIEMGLKELMEVYGLDYLNVDLSSL